MSAATWRDALLGAALLAVDPAGLGGAILRARHGPGRERWLATLGALLPEARPLRRLPPGADAGRLLGGLDLTATLAAGRRRAERGLLAEADGGVVVLPMAERAEAGLVGCLCRVLDTGEARAERDGLSLVSPARIAVVALDEGAEAEERIPGPLADRLALHLDLTALSARDAPAAPVSREDVLAARSALASRPADDALCAALVGAAAALGIGSLRAPLLALATARAATALFDGRLSTEAAAEIAGRLVLAPRAVCLPAPPDPEPDPETAPEPPAEAEREPADAPGESTGALADRVLDAVRAALPPDLLAAQAAQAARTEARLGRAGEERRALDRGRPVGSRPGRPRGGARLDLLGTLTAAAPWQPLRRRPGDAAGVRIAADDLRIRRLKRRSATASIFVVDASGSAAAARLAEAKGAIERLLAEAYIRRDQVALVAFRGQSAEILLPPTAAPALAKRRLAALPGGGGTPLATGIETAYALAMRLSGQGIAPHLVVLTDGRANIDREGRQGRAQAAADARAAAEACRRAGLVATVIDTGARPRAEARDIADALGARYLPMPRAEADALCRALSSAG